MSEHRLTTYEWESPLTHLKRAFGVSITMKTKKRWSRDAGAGFIAEEIKSIYYSKVTGYNIVTPDQHLQMDKLADLNLRETEECLKWIERELAREIVKAVEHKWRNENALNL